MERESMEFDVVIVGAGPSGLSASIRLMQLAQDAGRELSVCVLEKGAEVGAHILSGAVLEPHALDELIPDWKDRGAPLRTPVTKDEFHIFTEVSSFKLPHFLLPPEQNNHGNYIVSMGEVCRWLAEQAEGLGVEVYPGFAAARILTDDRGRVTGVATGDMGVGRDGEPTATFTPGMDLLAKYTLIAEGVRGSLAQSLMATFDLRADCDPQTYGLGFKEIWEIPADKHRPGLVLHGFGWPMDLETYGGGWMYHYGENLVSLGLVIGLDYKNPHRHLFEDFQKYKTNPVIREYLEGGRRISYGARAINEGGLQSIPKLTFPGGALIGCSAGFVNVPKIKGNHTAMKSGMLAAEAVFEAIADGRAHDEPAAFTMKFEQSWMWKELHTVRNARPAYRWGLLGGTLYAGIDLWLRGSLPWTLRHAHADHETLRPAAASKPIDYPKPDGVITFDKLSSVFLTNTNHAEDQPCHLTLKDASTPIAHNLPLYDEPAQRYCPAGVYEVVREADGSNPRFVINAQNCIHCKTCDIKDPTQNIVWTVPEGSGGPVYGAM